MKKTFLFVFAALAFTACKKDSTDSPAPSRTSLLTSKKWRETAYVSTIVSGGKTTTTDEYATSQACEKDNYTQFGTNKVLTIDEGTTKCDPSDPQTQTGTWDFNSDQTVLSFASPTFAGLTLPFQIVELTSTTMHLRFTQASGTDSETDDVTFTAF